MKSILLPAVFLIFLFSSCKKSSGVEGLPSGIAATVNGVNINFNIRPIARLTSNQTNLDVSGYAVINGDSTLIDVIITGETPVIKSHYIDNGPYGFEGPIIMYTTLASGSQIAQSYRTNYDLEVPTYITISFISSTNIQGTFSGTLTYPNTSVIQVITNGTFNVTID
jgi:hypothetical protein